MFGYNSFYSHFLIFYLIYGIMILVLFSPKRDENGSFTRGNLPKVLFLALPLYLLGVLRGDTVGGDLEYYLPYFDEMCRATNVSQIWSVSSQEPGYQLYTYLISRISPTHRAFFIGTFTLSFIGPVALIYRYSKMPFLSFVLYFAMGFYTNTFNNVRQSIAISICFLSLSFLFNRNLRKFLFSVLLAATFHYSAIFFTLLYPLVNKRITFKRIFFMLGGGSVLYVFSSMAVMSFLLNILSFKYDSEATLLSSDGSGWGMFTLYLLILIGELFLYSRFKNNDIKKDTLSFFIYLQVLAVLFQMYAPLFASMVRLTYYFFVPIIVVIPYLAYYFKSLRSIILSAGIALGILFLGMVYSKSDETGSNSQAVIPYVLVDKTIY